MAPRGSALRVAFWNTWLLRPRLWPGGPPVPGGDRLFAPDVAARAPLVGQALAGRVDVAALAEVFESPEQAAVRTAWPDHDAFTGPGRAATRFTGSGLLTIVDRASPAGARVTYSATHRFRAGGDLRDSDTFATKGALLTRVCLCPDQGPSPRASHHGRPALDLVSTHLFAGGEFLPVPGAADRARHHRVRMAQVDELIRFVERERDPAIPLLLVGDLNVAAHDPDPALPDPSDRYRDLASRLEPLGLQDLWAAHGTGPGPTCTFNDPADLPAHPDEPDAVTDADAAPAAAPGERIDHLWLGPSEVGDTTARASDLRRWAFPGRGARGGPAGSLSDHLALSLTLHLTAPS